MFHRPLASASSRWAALSHPGSLVAGPADPNYTATRRHFDGLERRYGAPTICFNLVRPIERAEIGADHVKERPIGAAFAEAVREINRQRPGGRAEIQLESLDLHGLANRESAQRVIAELGEQGEPQRLASAEGTQPLFGSGQRAQRVWGCQVRG